MLPSLLGLLTNGNTTCQMCAPGMQWHEQSAMPAELFFRVRVCSKVCTARRTVGVLSVRMTARLPIRAHFSYGLKRG